MIFTVKWPLSWLTERIRFSYYSIGKPSEQIAHLHTHPMLCPPCPVLQLVDMSRTATQCCAMYTWAGTLGQTPLG